MLQNLYINSIAVKKIIMLKKIVYVLWTFSLQDYWVWLWSKTEVDEKVIAGTKEAKKRGNAAIKALKGKR
jgi:hypothetical protein